MVELNKQRGFPCQDCGAETFCEAHELASSTGVTQCQIENFAPFAITAATPAADAAKKAIIDEFEEAMDLASLLFGEDSISFEVFVAYPEGRADRFSVKLDCYDIERNLYDSRTKRHTRSKIIEWKDKIDWMKSEVA